MGKGEETAEILTTLSIFSLGLEVNASLFWVEFCFKNKVNEEIFKTDPSYPNQSSIIYLSLITKLQCKYSTTTSVPPLIVLLSVLINNYEFRIIDRKTKGGNC